MKLNLFVAVAPFALLACGASTEPPRVTSPAPLTSGLTRVHGSVTRGDEPAARTAPPAETPAPRAPTVVEEPVGLAAPATTVARAPSERADAPQMTRENAQGASAPADVASASEPTPRAPARSGSTLRVASMTTNGVEIRSLSCELKGGGGGLFGPIVLGATIGKQRGALAKCGGEGAQVKWTTDGKRVTSAEASTGDAKRDACVKRVLMQLASVDSGTCSATLRVASRAQR